MAFVRALLASPPSTPLSRYTTWNGVFYMSFGLLTYAWPGVLQVLFFARPFEAGESGLARLIGFTLMVIGYFYVMGARTRADSFGLATVVDRALVPFFLLPLAFFGGVDKALVLPFTIVDPLLGLGAFLVWRANIVPSEASQKP